MKNSEDWRLDSLTLELGRWGEEKDKYKGSIKFSNGEGDSFTFKLHNDLAQPYIDLIAADVVKGAELLGQRLIESLGLKER